MISASIVLFKPQVFEIENVIKSCLNNHPTLTLYLINNSPLDEFRESYSQNDRIIYLHNPSNPGFGASHNIAIKKSMQGDTKYHFIINPDIRFNMDVITPMIDYIVKNPKIGMMMPKVLNNDGSIQHLPKLLPSPFWIFRRKLKKIDPNNKKFIDNYELRNFPKDRIYNVPILSGCFTLLRLEAIKEIGMYDEKFFMYFEDFDLSRRMHQKYKTIYFPEVSVYHGYEGGANKNFKLFEIFIKSMFNYFNKWGWFFDTERKKINKETLKQFNS